jgi:phospholipid N-methyltransferase
MIMDKEYKKKHGIFFTPDTVVNKIVDNLKINNNSKILEPSFGEGIFIDSIISANKKKDLEITGIELDKHLFKNSSKKYSNKKNVKIYNQNFLTDFHDDNFDLIIGNPPYGSKIEKKEFELLKSNKIFDNFGKEPAILFTLKAISLLKNHGRLIFILPSTILRVHSFLNFRNYLKSVSKINTITNLHQVFPDVGYETFVLDLTLQRQMTDYTIKVEDFDKRSHSELSFSFIKERNIIPLYLDKKIEKIITKIEDNTIKLSSISTMPRGISLSVSNDLISKEKKSDYTKLLTGRNIAKYGLNQNPEYYVPNYLYTEKFKEKKILSQNLAYKIVSTLDTKGRLVNDTVNTIYVSDEEYLTEYVLAIINSKIMIFYLQNVITNRARLNIHLDSPYVGEIPIKKLPKNEQEQIKKDVDDLIFNKNNNARILIERKINEIYGIDENFDFERYSIFGKANI